MQTYRDIQTYAPDYQHLEFYSLGGPGRLPGLTRRWVAPRGRQRGRLRPRPGRRLTGASSGGGPARAGPRRVPAPRDRGWSLRRRSVSSGGRSSSAAATSRSQDQSGRFQVTTRRLAAARRRRRALARRLVARRPPRWTPPTRDVEVEARPAPLRRRADRPPARAGRLDGGALDLAAGRLDRGCPARRGLGAGLVAAARPDARAAGRPVGSATRLLYRRRRRPGRSTVARRFRPRRAIGPTFRHRQRTAPSPGGPGPARGGPPGRVGVRADRPVLPCQAIRRGNKLLPGFPPVRRATSTAYGGATSSRVPPAGERERPRCAHHPAARQEGPRHPSRPRGRRRR